MPRESVPLTDANRPDRSPRTVQFQLAPKSLAIIVLTAAALWTLGQLVPLLVTILFALIVAGTLSPAVKWLEKRGIKRNWALVLTFGACAAAAGIIAVLTLPALWSQIVQMVSDLPKHQARVAEFLDSNRMTASLATAVRNFKPAKAAGNAGVATTVAASMSVIEVLGYAATALVLSVYFVADQKRMRAGLYAVVPRRFHVRLARILLRMEPIVGGYMRGQIITSLAMGAFTLALLGVNRIPNAVALATFAALTDVIPFVGCLLATTPAVLSALSHGTGATMIVLTAMLLYQEFESRVIVPRVYGSALRLPSTVVIIALLVGGKLGGVVGALLALPLAATLRMVIEELRIDLPGDDTDDPNLRMQDEKAERAYAKQSAGSSPAEAGAVATVIAEKVLRSEPEPGK